MNIYRKYEWCNCGHPIGNSVESVAYNCRWNDMFQFQNIYPEESCFLPMIKLNQR